MKNKENMIQEIKKAVENEKISDFDTFNTRECDSENYSGVSITITGNIIPIRPIIEAVESLEYWRIEDIGMYNDVPTNDDEYTYGITAFVAYVNNEYTNNIFT